MKRKRILVVDDDDSLRTSVRKILEKADYDVLTAKNAASAWELLVLQKQSVDLLLTDYRMPEKNGLDLVRDLLLNLGDALPPVVVMTAFGEIGNYLEAMALGVVQEYINKPLSRSTLLVLVDSVLHGHGRRNPNAQPSPD